MEYPKIETLFDRDEKTHKVVPGKLRDPIYGIFKTWQFTEKIDGTNVRILWNPKEGGLRFGGRTDNALIPAKLLNWLNANISSEKLRSVFPDAATVIYSEGYGAGIQRGGGYNDHQEIVVFDVRVGEWWLNWENTCDVAQKLGLRTVPFIGEMELPTAIEMVKAGFDSVLAREILGQKFPAEGLVGRTVEPLFDKKGHRIIIKLKTRDF